MLEFIVRLCLDVLIDVLHFGDRRNLCQLERAGQRFHRIVDKLFGEKPFIRLNLEISTPKFVFFHITLK